MANAHIPALTNTQLSAFCGQLAMVLHSGISAIEGIAIMREDAASKDELELLRTVEETLTATGSISQALQSARVFPSYLVHMTRIGEQSGTLDEVMTALCEHYQREDDIAASVKHAVTYPFIMVFMMAAVLIVLVTKVLPVFNDAFRQLGHEMSGFSQSLLNFGVGLSRYSLAFVCVFAVLVLVFFLCAYTGKGRTLFFKAARACGIGRSLFEKTAACRVASGMSIILKSGLNLEQSMELSIDLVDDPSYSKRILLCQKCVQEGKPFAEALAESNLFSGLYVRMASIGYKTGTLDEVLKQIAVRYQEEIDRKISRVIAVLEPTLVAVLSLVVGVVLLSVMLPLLGIMSSF